MKQLLQVLHFHTQRSKICQIKVRSSKKAKDRHAPVGREDDGDEHNGGNSLPVDDEDQGGSCRR